MKNSGEEIEERKKAEQERTRLEVELSRVQKMEVLGILAGGVAHDLNNVLSGIVSYPDLLMVDLPANDPLRGPLGIIKKSGENAAAIVQDLLALARRGVMIKERISLNDILNDYFQSPEYVQLCFFNPGVVMEQHLDQSLHLLEGSAVHLQKTVMNLVVNAFEAITGAGSVVVTTENRRIDRPVRGYEVIESGDYAVIEIRDSGAGMSREVIEKIFEPFYSRKQLGRSGTGLGMTVVWGTIKDHGGYVDIESMPGTGTTITVYFPAVLGDLSFKPGKSVEKKIPDNGRGQTVLIVDDVLEQQEIGRSILEKLGYKVWAVSSGNEAVDFLKKQSVDLVLLDMIMPTGLDGLETYREIRTFIPQQKVILVSGYSETARVSEALELGIGAYLKKPYTVEQLSRVVSMELEK